MKITSRLGGSLSLSRLWLEADVAHTVQHYSLYRCGGISKRFKLNDVEISVARPGPS